ncbi:probable disease resistance protein At4g27220 [Salvia splendens]|uniref:probable disease resistance protein At4g27220 n=1 Tax=Salvia splendens TaxID=180675 RepID=UPI001C262768|nr:probable disease resistance protein At4g27220 [Salvia splendens]XP_042034862.1 probable disease resistance protein At4g27220 [Salvia splendens]
MLSRIFEPFLKKVRESILSKLVEQMADNAHNNLKSIKDFELNLKALQKKLKSLSAKASDVEEQIKNSELSGRKKRKREVDDWLEDVRSFENQVKELGAQVESEGFIVRLMDGGLPAKLNDEVDLLVERSRHFGELVLDVCGSRGDKLLTNEMVGEAFNKNLEKILEHLESGQVSSVGVHGMGGVGKTTLAKHIHNRLLQHSQGRVIWVTVSKEFSVTTLQDKIARFIGLDFGGEDNEDKRAARLHTTLSQMKNSVLILDDVWENIDFLKVGCPVSVECCRLIITTRILKLCRQICCQKVIPVQTLHHHEAWKLFNETLRNEIELDSLAEKTARSVAELCGGLPLAIVTVAGSMRRERAIHTWRTAYAELKERVSGIDDMGVGKVYNVLKYSFDRLNGNCPSQGNEFNTLQHCFLHCALYPEDKEFTKDFLVREFISVGLVEERKTRREQVEQGHSVLDKLLNVCLLESCAGPSRFDPTECVKMHDLLRSMALNICEGKYKVRASDKSLREIPKEAEWEKDLEKVSLMKNDIGRIEEGMSPDCPKLSTLLLCYNIGLEFIPDSFFSKMQGLCTLDLRGTRITKLPNSICALKSLKALLLWSCRNLEHVPYLGEMKELRELNLSNTAITKVPGGVGELFNLKFLALNVHTLEMLPRGLFLKLGKLQHLELPLRIQVVIEEIENLKLLEEFSGRVENMNDLKSLITSWGSRVCDTCYSILVGSYHEDEYNTIGGTCHDKELFLFKCDLKDERVLAEGIVQQCEGLGICFVDGLKILRIESCGGIEYIWRSESQMSAIEEIELVELDAIKGLIEKGEIGASAAHQPVFSSLTKLRIEKCNRMRISLPGAPNLEVIDIRECEEIEEIFEDEGTGSLTLPKLKTLWLTELPRLRKVGILSRAPNLEVIDIRECEEIEEIFEDEGTGSLTLPKLKTLRLKELPRLRKVGILSSAPNLEDIHISCCEEIEEIFDDEGTGSLSLPKLKTLRLKELPRLRKVGILSRAPNLEGIHIRDCEKIEEIFEDEGTGSPTLPKLKSLRLEELRRLRKVGILSSAPNLEVIDISKCEEIEDVFDDEGRGCLTLPKLKTLCLRGQPRLRKVGILSSAPNLEDIHISCCEEIEEIFEDEGTGSLSLPKLKTLRLEGLPRLRKVGILLSAPNLEAINISKCEEIEDMFDDEGRGCLTLPKLKTLCLRGQPRLRKVGILSSAPNLEDIHISCCEEIEEIFEDEGTGSLSLPKLKTLRLKGLPRLRKVGILLSAPNLEAINISECEEIEDVFDDEGRGCLTLPKLKTLYLNGQPRLRKVGILSRAPNLEVILITKCKEIEDVFDDEGRGFLTLLKLKYITLKELPRLRKVGILSSAPNLEVIDISKCEEIEDVFDDEGSGCLTFPKLKNIWLKELPRLRKVGILSSAPNLEDIHICWCEEIEEIFEDEGTGSLSLPKLKTLRLKGLPRLRKVGILSSAPNLEDIDIRECEEIEDVFDDEGTGSLTLPKLISLELEELPTLKSLCKGTTIICNSIEAISIKECPRLMNKLPVDVDSAVPRRCKIKVNTEVWESLMMSDNPNLSIFERSHNSR